MGEQALNMYFSTLLLYEQRSEGLQDLLSRRGQLQRHNLDPRPRVTLGMCNGDVVLGPENSKEFFDQVRSSALSGRPLRVFSTAPGDQVAQFAGNTFIKDALFYDLRPLSPSRDAERPNPFQYRLFEIAPRDAGGVPNIDRTAVVEGGHGPKLYVDPLDLSFDSDAIDQLFGNAAAAARAVQGWFLPPVRTRASGYFRPECAGVRRALQGRIRGDVESSLPTVCAAWQLVDEDLIRDLLMDGGSVEVLDHPTEATRLRLCCHAGSGTWARYRADFFTSPERISTSPEFVTLAKNIRQDLERLSPGLEVDTRPDALDWDSVELDPFTPDAIPLGSWQRIDSLRALLGPAQADMLYRDVLLPSAARVGTTPDHDMAERLFVEQYWRCPWATGAPPGPWRAAVMALVRNAPRFGFDARDLARGYSEIAPGDVTPDGPRWRVAHQWTSPGRTLEWRLLLPLGSIFQPRGTIRFDRGAASRMDAQLVLG
jgi:hypothetical protein